MTHPKKIPLWRNSPPEAISTGTARLSGEFVFPSGRQALSFALRQVGLERRDRIALPEWSSHCVVSAVSWHATPVPMREALEFGIPVQAILIYEQWGWPFCRNAYPELQERFGHAAILWDRVDSAHPSLIPYELPSLEIISLSKLLGLYGGGLCRQGGEPLRVPPVPLSPVTAAWLGSDAKLLDTLQCREYFKNDSEVPHPQVTEWVAANDIAAAIGQEKRCRIEHLHIVRDHWLTSDWPEWMREAVDAGAAPGIVPLLRGAPRATLQQAVATLALECATESALYHFNWSGNPLSPSYEACLGVPVHGQADCLPRILQTLERTGVVRTNLS